MDLSEQTQVAQTDQSVQGREITLPLKALFRDPLSIITHCEAPLLT